MYYSEVYFINVGNHILHGYRVVFTKIKKIFFEY